MSAHNDQLKRFMDIFESDKRLTIYINGIEIFLSKSSDGFVAGYTNEQFKAGTDDHVTFLFGKKEKQIQKVHRTVDSDEDRKYIYIDLNYFKTGQSIKQYFKDLQAVKIPKLQKITLFLIYYMLHWAWSPTLKSGKVEVLDKETANKLGLNYPTIIIKLNLVQRLIFHRMMTTSETLIKKQLLKKAREQNVPGYKVRIDKKNTT